MSNTAIAFTEEPLETRGWSSCTIFTNQTLQEYPQRVQLIGKLSNKQIKNMTLNTDIKGLSSF